MRTNIFLLLGSAVASLAGCAGSAPTPPTSSPPNPVSSSAGPQQSSTPAASTHATPGGVVKNQPPDAIPLECAKKARDVQGNAGSSWYVRCPAECPPAGKVWGTDVYTDDSSLCMAAIHAGRLEASRGGVVLVTWVPGSLTYLGSVRNGITSATWGQWRRGFFLQSVDDQGQPTSPPVTVLPEDTARLTCDMGGGFLPHAVGTSVRIICPPECTQGSVWGTELYTSDSRICKAAIHAGVVSAAEGGEATITYGEAQDAFAGSERNGVTTAGFGHFGGSFRFSR